jgi:hypothetical protein
MTQLYISLPPSKESPDFDGWLIQVAQYLRDYLGLTYVNYVDRGDNSSWDKTITDFTADGTWKTGASGIDLSAIIPADAKLAVFLVAINDNSVGSYFSMRKRGNSNAYNVFTVAVNVDSVTSYGDVTCAVHSTRFFDYIISAGCNDLYLTVKGWFI